MKSKNNEIVFHLETLDKRIFSFTAHELYTKFMEEANNEFCIPISEVLNVCNKKDFPKNYAEKIKLTFFKSFINSDCSIFDIPFKERFVLFSCYNSLSNENEKEFNEKRNFLIKFLDNVTADFILQEFNSNSDNYIKACKIYNSWKQSLIEDLLSKNKVRFTCLNKKSLFKKFERILIKNLGKKGFMEYVKENKSQQGNVFQYAKVATNI